MVVLIWVWDVVVLICSDGFVVSAGWICCFGFVVFMVWLLLVVSMVRLI